MTKLNADILKEIYNTPADISNWVNIGAVPNGSVYLFLVTSNGMQYLCPIYVNTAPGVRCECPLYGPTFLAVESQNGYVNAKIYNSPGTLNRIYRIF
nr:MAG TPA: hypothetical protein [Caudoviricetes sp.]